MNIVFWWRKTEGKKPMEEQDLDGRIIFKRTFKKQDVGHVLD